MALSSSFLKLCDTSKYVCYTFCSVDGEVVHWNRRQKCFDHIWNIWKLIVYLFVKTISTIFFGYFYTWWYEYKWGLNSPSIEIPCLSPWFANVVPGIEIKKIVNFLFEVFLLWCYLRIILVNYLCLYFSVQIVETWVKNWFSSNYGEAF